ncbi:hypothetical protein ACEWY4_001223 [Coilia grayii]|uniref:protein-tyrosine-phosphatase n=1 Tax=Coilia grayii TaxID=363190 RepID=A0ABD1KYW5_9TELE
MDTQVPILRDFLAEVAWKEAVQEDAENSFSAEFMRLKHQSTKIRTDKTFPSKAAEKQENVKKNRYKDIVPFDHSRVRLTLNVSNTDSDYINASFIKGVSGQKAYIATQGPLSHTVLDLWRMLWQYEVQVVVIACREFEMGRKKCERYWPATTEDVFVCEPFIVTCVSEEEKGDYLTRVLNVTYQSASRIIRQLHYMNWPDHGVPDSIPPILELLQEMRSYQEHEEIPICIHCSAGCGRTGALCAIDYTWNLLKKQCIPENFSIFDLVQDMRTQRPSVVQTKEQYALVYRAIKFLFQHHLEAVKSPGITEQEGDSPKSAPTQISSDFSSDLSDLSETEVEPHMECGPRFMEPLERSSHVLCIDVPVTKSHEEQEAKPTSVRRPEDILQAMAANPPQKPLLPAHTADTACTWSSSQTSGLMQATSTQHSLNATHTKDSHNSHMCVMEELREAPVQGITHAQIPNQDLPTQQAVAVTHTPQVMQIPLVQQKTHTQQRVHIVHTFVTSRTPSQTQHAVQNDTWRCAGATPHLADLCVTVEDPYFSPVPSRLPGENSPDTGQGVRPPQITLNKQPLQQGSHAHTVALAFPVSDDEEPPLLPERTPESFVLAADGDLELLKASAPTENDGPSSPVPPLPERTPQSFELASPDDLGKLMNQLKHTDSVGKVGVSSEWSGNTHTSPAIKKSWSRSKSLKVRMTLPAPPPAPPTVAPPDHTPAPTASTPHTSQGPPRSLTPPLPERTPESFIVPSDEGGPCSPAPPLPDRTPESFQLPLADVPDIMDYGLPQNKRRSLLCLRDILPRGEAQQPLRCTSAIFLAEDSKSLSLSLPRNSALCPTGSPLQLMVSSTAAATAFPCVNQQPALHSSATPLPADAPAQQQPLALLSGSPLRMQMEAHLPLQRVGSSSEWAGPSQPRAQDPFKNRSKSVKVKSSNPAPLSVIAPHVAISTAPEGASAGPTEQQQQLGATGSAGTEGDSGKSMTRKKSWRRLIPRNKHRSAPPPAPLPPPYGATSGFKFVFGHRFGKPKGPRTRPETWV